MPDTPHTKQAATCPSFNETDRLRHALDWIANHATTLEEAQALARRTYGEHPSAHPVSAGGHLRYSERNLLEAVRSGKTASTAEVEIVLERLGRTRIAARDAEVRAAELLSGIRGRNNTIDRLTAENERLREALERIARLDVEFFTGTTRGCIKIARAALAPKHPQAQE